MDEFDDRGHLYPIICWVVETAAWSVAVIAGLAVTVCIWIGLGLVLGRV